MSSLPGLDLEDYLMWNYDLIVNGDGSANKSLQIAEALGTAVRRRKELTTEEFAPLIALFEPHRDEIEYRLSDFDDETQSWRDYAGYAFDFIPPDLYAKGGAILDNLNAMTPTPLKTETR